MDSIKNIPKEKNRLLDKKLFKEAQQWIVGGVNSPVRAFKHVDSIPLFISKAKGAYVFDEEGTPYLDYVSSWGPMILGHAHPVVMSAVQKALENGLSFGAPTVIETQLAALVCQLMPSIEKIRFVSSGTEAAMTAVRLARGFTGRKKIIKCAGGYHGHSDSLLVKAGSGLLTLGIPDSQGVLESFAQEVLVAEFNDLAGIEAFFSAYPTDIAGMIIEPVAGNMGCVLPKPGFLKNVRQLCDHYKSLLIFDEVMTGFRVALGGAQAVYNVKPDITVLAKIIGGGMPVGALGGRREILDCLAPLGNVYQAGTLSGNPVAMTAGFATLKFLSDYASDIYPALDKNTDVLLDNIKKLAVHYKINLMTQHLGSLFSVFFTDQKEIKNFKDVQGCSVDLFKLFFRGLFNQYIYWAPSAFESGFMSIMHGEKEIQATLNAVEYAFSCLRRV